MYLKCGLLVLVCVFCFFSCGSEEADNQEEPVLKVNGSIIEPKANLQGKDFSNTNLQNANLQEANLQRAIFNFALLDGVNLQGADLSFAFLRGASLVDANLAFADLRLADLQGANLRNAQLQRTDLRSTNLLDSTLDSANFQGAVYNNNTQLPKSFNPLTHEMILDDMPLSDEDLPDIPDEDLPDIPTSNKILSLDGDGDSVEIPDSDSLSFDESDGVTFEAWIAPIQIVNKQRILSKWGARSRPTSEYSLDIFTPDIRFVISGETQSLILKNAVTIPLNEWTHLAGVLDGQTGIANLYVNGTLIQSTVTNIRPARNTNEPLYIGQDASVANGQFWWHGYLDEIRMWNIARTQAEIQAAMDKTLRGNERGLVGYWNFDNGIARDLSPKGNHGILRGDAKIIDLP